MAANDRVSLWTLLKNRQMAVLCLSSLCDPLATTSLLSYILFQIQYLSPNASQSAVAIQAGILVGSGSVAKILTGIFWGRFADSRGRKPVLVGGFLSSCISCIGYGFSTSLAAAIFWQVIRASMSCNVAMTQTVVAEMYMDRKSSVRGQALLLLLLISSFGMLLGPLLGGFASSRTDVTQLLIAHPYSLPNIVVAIFYGCAAIGTWLFVDETLVDEYSKTHGPDSQHRLIDHMLLPVDHDEHQDVQVSESKANIQVETGFLSSSKRSMFREACTPQVVATLVAHFSITGHISSFALVKTALLSTAIADSVGFAGGVGLDPAQIGTFMFCATALAVLLQAVLLPKLVKKLGTVRVWRLSLWVFPAVYLLAPLPSLVASRFFNTEATTIPPEAMEHVATASRHPGFAAWISISLVMILFMAARTGAQPPMVILINAAVPHPRLRGTINTMSTTVGNLARCIFPVSIMFVYGLGLQSGSVVWAFSIMAAIAVLAVAASRWVALGLDDNAVLRKPPIEEREML